MDKKEIKKITTALRQEIKPLLRQEIKPFIEKAAKDNAKASRENAKKLSSELHHYMDHFLIKFTLLLKSGRALFSQFDEKSDSLEETILSIYHNIKRNQFLYAHYPEEWDKTFLEMKKKIKEENCEFCKCKGKKRGKDENR